MEVDEWMAPISGGDPFPLYRQGGELHFHLSECQEIPRLWMFGEPSCREAALCPRCLPCPGEAEFQAMEHIFSPQIGMYDR